MALATQPLSEGLKLSASTRKIIRRHASECAFCPNQLYLVPVRLRCRLLKVDPNGALGCANTSRHRGRDVLGDGVAACCGLRRRRSAHRCCQVSAAPFCLPSGGLAHYHAAPGEAWYSRPFSGSAPAVTCWGSGLGLVRRSKTS